MNDTVVMRQLAGASTLLLLEQDVRRAQTQEELVFLLVNRTASVLTTDIAFFFPLENNRLGPLQAVSGVSEPETQSPMVMWLNSFRHKLPTTPTPKIIDKPSSSKDIDQWSQWLPPEGMLCPLTTPLGKMCGVLLLVRVLPWQTEELELAGRLGLCYGHSLEALQLHRSPRWRRGRFWSQNRVFLAVVLFLTLLMAWPVRQSVMAKAKVVAEKPRLVTAPLDGVVASIEVTPNSRVRAGQLLVTMDRTTLVNRRAMAVEALRVAETEALRAEQLAFSREEMKASLPMLRARIEERTVELHHAQGLLERSRVRSPGEGLAVFTSAEEWLGQPVRVGQRIMVIADPGSVAVAMDLSIHDAVSLEPGAEFLLFLDTDPLHPRPGRVIHSGYEAETTPDGVVAFAIRGKLTDDKPPPRIGLRGSARLFGERTSLFFLLFRRPLSILRQFVGF